MNKLRQLLDGKKTYLVGATLVVFAVSGVVTGNLTTEQAFFVVLNGLGFSSLRASVSKAK